MRVVTPVAAGDGFSVSKVTIRAETAGWSDPEPSAGHRLTLVRRGVFRARVGGHRLVADPSVAYAGGPGDEQSIAHRPRCPDSCTAIVMSEPFAAELTGGSPLPPALPVTGELAVTHRLLTARADPYELVVRLVGGLLTHSSVREAPRGRRTATTAAHRRLAEAARELLALDPSAEGLRSIAARLGCSPYHLSRVFHDQTGHTLTGHRNHLRALRALDAIEAGERDLARLAAELGFADHAHLTRTVRRECGHTPQALRRLLR
jgi:AraC-like DNA-binding protein